MFNGKMKALTFSFDDGLMQDIRLVDVFNKYALKGTFNLNSERLGKINPFSVLKFEHAALKREDIKHIYDGHEIAAHTLNHAFLPKIEDEMEIIRQVEQDRLNLSDIVGYEVLGMAYPGGGQNNDDRVSNIIKNNTNVRYARTITSTHNFDLQDNLYRFNPSIHIVASWEESMQLAQEFVSLKTDSPKLFYIWGHSFEFDYEPASWDKLEEFCSLVSGKEDIFYGTNKEILLGV
jgi:peptidoglycan/xylan/chitin deacetylase (PgdA/CDA1 family)